MTSPRTMVLLNALRKTLSLVVFARITHIVDVFLTQAQSGFRYGRSTADVAFGYRWLAAKTQRFQSSVYVLGIDMSRAFDTIRRDKLMIVLESFLGESELQVIIIRLVETTLELRLKIAIVQNSHPPLVHHKKTVYRL